MLDLGTLGGANSEGLGINASGQATGYIENSNGTHRAFLYSAGTMADLNSLISPSSGWVLEEGHGINDLGQITGFGEIGGQHHAFLLTPVPESSTWLMATLGARPACGSCVGGAVRRLLQLNNDLLN